MLFLLFQLGEDRYALEAARVLEVLPLVRIKKIPLAAAGIAGAFNYRGTAVPAIDLTAAALGRPASARLSTRIVVVAYGAERQPLGLIAENATEMLRRTPADFRPAGATTDGARYLGPVTADAAGKLIQRVELEHLLPAEVRGALFRTVAATAVSP
jgi:chemotaxis-related protein WspB